MKHFILNDKNEKLYVNEGDNVAEFWNIRKYEPVIPASMSGDVINIGAHNTIKYDIENLKKYAPVLEEREDNEKFVITEKLHGTFCMLGYVKGLNCTDLMFSNTFVSSKGLGGQGLVFKMNEKNLQQNLYTRVAVEHGLFNKINEYVYNNKNCKKLIICGEIFGAGVQDLAYGMDKPAFRAFDVYLDDKFLDAALKYEFLAKMGIDTVPVFATMAYNRKTFDELAKGKTSFEGKNVKEGIVITPYIERTHPSLGRVILKHINDEYLLRKNATEFN